MPKLRCGINTNLATELHSKVRDSSLVDINKIRVPSNVMSYAVIRSKGGSGERHLINSLIELLPKDKKIFICYENAIAATPEIVTKYFSPPIEEVIHLEQLNEVKGGIINLKWRITNQLQQVFDAIGKINQDCIIIFSPGTSSAGELLNRVHSISYLCEHTFISVDTLSEESLESALKLCNIKKLEWESISFGCWTMYKEFDKYEHDLTILNAGELKKIYG